MQTFKATTSFAFWIVLASALTALTHPRPATAQLPDSIAGRGIAMAIVDGIYPLASDGYYLFLPADAGNSYRVVGIAGVTDSRGTYAFTPLSSSLASVVINDPLTGTLNGNFTSLSPDTGSFSVQSGSVSQSGKFQVFSWPIPSSVAGKTFRCAIADGATPFARSGSFILQISRSGNAYTIRGVSHVADSAGTYSYSHLGASVAGLRLDDAMIGESTGYLAFSSTSTGGFGLKHSTPRGFQIGQFEVIDLQPPAVTINSPAKGARLSGPVTISGTAEDDSGVAEIEWRLENPQGVGDYHLLSGTSPWSGIIPDLIPGPNTIRVRARDTAGNVSAGETRAFFYVAKEPLTLLIHGDGTVTPNLNGQSLELGKLYSLTAKAGRGSLFSHWEATAVVATPRLTFTMQSNLTLEATFVPNPFLSSKGAYTGIFQETNAVRHESSGFFTATLRESGAYSARMNLGGRRYALTGQLDLEGQTSKILNRPGMSPLAVHLEADPASEQMTGSISDGIWTAEIVADKAVFNAAHDRAPFAGRYNLMIPGSLSTEESPAGCGFAQMIVSASGWGQLKGTLADGTPFSQRAPVSREGQWPLYVSLHGGHGLLLSRLDFVENPETDLSGDVNWIKPALAKGKYYPSGFARRATLVGSRYGEPTANGLVLPLTAAHISFRDGNLTSSFANAVTLEPGNKLVNHSGNKLTARIVKSTGLLSGSVVPPDSAKPISFRGIILQKQNMGVGFFLGTNQSGSVLLGQESLLSDPLLSEKFQNDKDQNGAPDASSEKEIQK